jgi:preprotein translocase subunit SecE
MKKTFKKIFSYFAESKDELRKVVWPTRNRVVTMTVTVVILVLVVSAFLGFFDYVLSKALTYLITLGK